jgi:ribosomal-protein-alanine N-acetyltransferase
VTLRPAAPEDAPALAVLHAAAFPPGEAWGAEALGLMLALPHAFGALAPEAGFVLASAIAGQSEILTLAVVPARGGGGGGRAGLGQALLQAAMAEAGRRGAGEMFLEVATGNAAARALYESAGFRAAGLRRRYYADGADALVLRAALSPSGSADG